MIPKLSIITINYNNVCGVEKTIKSVINQSSNEFEYLIIDGGSTDGSVDIISSLINGISNDLPLCGKVKWISEKDNGIYHAMNKGIIMAKGEYCQFLNSGDVLCSDKVIEEMLRFERNSSIVYGNMIKVFSDGRKFYDRKIQSLSFFTFYKGTINHTSAFIKRNLFEKYGLYDESLQIVSDWKFYLIAVGLNNEETQYVNLDVALFDMTGVSNSNTELLKSERKKVLEELLPHSILKDYDNHWFDIEQMKRIKKYKVIYYLFWLVERGLFKMEKVLSKHTMNL